jgi:hypothetical protein
MVQTAKANHPGRLQPTEDARQVQNRLYVTAKRRKGHRPSTECQFSRSDDLGKARMRSVFLSCMPHVNIVNIIVKNLFR